MRERKTIWILYLTLGAMVCGCKKDFVAINTDPGQITEGQNNFNYLFTNAELQTSGNTDGNGYEDWRNNLIYSGAMIQHLSSTQPYWDGDKYLYSATYNSAYWDKNYPNSIANIVEVAYHAARDSSQYNLYQMTRIFKSFMFQRMTDMYGDCPYSQAGQGYRGGITSPVYDRQQEIYAGLLQELWDAAQRLDGRRANTVGAADLLYGGDVIAWRKFAYSLMVRLAMRMSKVDTVSAKQWVRTALAGGVMESNTDNAIIQHQAVSGTPVVNGTGLILIGNDANGCRLSKTFVDYLRNTNDPRLPYLATVCAKPGSPTDKGDTSAGIQKGQPNGYDAPNTGGAWDLVNAPGYSGGQNSYSVVNRYTFSRLDAPTFFLTYGETALLLAEAAARGWIAGDAGSYYTAGVRGAMGQLRLQAGAGPSAGIVESWLALHPFDVARGIQQINEQYWVAGFMDENECFANWRRSGFPVLTPVNYPGNVTGGQIPRRFTYPQDEASTNGAHYQEAVGRMENGDRMTSRVWWDRP